MKEKSVATNYMRKTRIVAEIGINHNGDLQIAKDLILMLRNSGCDAVKFQKRDIEVVYDKEFLDQKRESPFGTTQRAQKEGLEFGEKEYDAIDAYCKDLGIPWFASTWDVNSFLFLQKYDLEYNKVCSPMIVAEDLLHHVANEGKLTFISTGMSSIDMIKNAVGIFMEYGCPFELLHCISIYPPAPHQVHLKKMAALKALGVCEVGFSDHSTHNLFSLAACALGASTIERHITLDKRMYGSDQSSSIDPTTLMDLVKSVRIIDEAQGSGNICVLEEEVPTMVKLRSHIR